MKRGDIVDAAADVCARVDLRVLDGARVFVTGASGLIGTWVLASLVALRETGSKVEVFAQALSTPSPHLRDMIARGGLRLVQTDLSDFREYPGLPEADVVLHGAGYAQPLRYMENPGGTLQVHAAGTLALLQRLRPGGHFLFMSSAAVYTGRDGMCGESVVGTTTPAHPRASYIEGKRAGETACHAYRGQGVHATAVRLGDVYGPGTRPHDKRALNSFIERALTQNEIRLLDAGLAKRSYCYASDAVELMWRILLTGRDTVYNVGGHDVTTIGALARAVGRLTGAPVHLGSPSEGVSGAPDVMLLDLTRVDEEFGRHDRVGLDEGLSATIAWQRALYGRD